ncbi:hypothetical protein AX14_008751 [Amanita brunnescens Koide BX004]|nr:hypothetical protein AX14_008751 [Amanita brunnescens Koide BX004]
METANYQDLYAYSVSDYAFWEDLWDFMDIRYSVRFTKMFEEGKLLKEIPIWFPGARLNYAENLLSRNDDSIACTASSELGQVSHCSYRELHERVRVMASALRSSGVNVGDRVAAIVTNSVTAVVVALATTSIGAIYSSTATDLGASAVLDRYRQIRPKILFCDIEAPYTGKKINVLPKVVEVIRDLSKHGLEMAVLLPSSITGVEAMGVDHPMTVSLSKFLKKADNRPLTFTQLPFNHPAFILYSSGTSGKPKCIVHSAGGVLLQTKKELMQSFSCRAGDTFFQYSSTGWMMWNLMLSTLSFGGRIILYEGSPFYPTARHFLKFIDQQQVNYFGTSPRFLSEVQARGINPLDVAQFKSLRFVVSAGAVLTPALHKWSMSAFGKCVYTATGGTDTCSTFISFSPALPVYAGELQSKSLGMKIEIFDSAGNNIEHTYRPGELVCTRPHPSLPMHFWGDETGERLRENYFDVFPGIWRQGDFAVSNPSTKGVVILGRSDGVLNPSGIRFGSSEIYNLMTPFSSRVADTLCIGQRRPGIDTDERVLLFLKMHPGHKFSQKLASEIRDAIKIRLSPRHVPAWIGQVEDIPYTLNGKKVEIAVKKIVCGGDIQSTATIENPESLKLYYKFRRLQHLDQRARARL